MNISIKEIINKYAKSLEKEWNHDRNVTVGASEIGQCARKIFFLKHDAPRDPDYQVSWGALLRGIIMEEQFWVPALRSELPEGVKLLFAYPEQKTLVSGYLSETTDGLLVWPNGYCINLDCKTEDPRNNRQGAKTQHKFQTHTQVGIIREQTDYKPDESIITYIDASFWDKIDEPRVAFDPRIYAAAHARAEQIMTARDALELPPEGRLSGGSECRYCAWASHCSAVTIAGVPREVKTLPNDIAAELEGLRDAHIIAHKTIDEWSETKKRIEEDIKKHLRDNNTRRFVGDGWSVSYSIVNGRTTLDIAAIEDSGFDLDPYRKTGTATERLTIR